MGKGIKVFLNKKFIKLILITFSFHFCSELTFIYVEIFLVSSS